MSDEESRFPFKYIIAAGVVIGLIILSTAGIFIYKMMSGKAKPAFTKKELETITFEAKDSLTFDEFTIFLSETNETAVIKFTLNAEVASTRVKEYLERKRAEVRDIISRHIMSMTIMEIKNKYKLSELHKILMEDLNSIVDRGVKGNNPDDKGNIPRLNLVVKVNIFDFSAVTID